MLKISDCKFETATVSYVTHLCFVFPVIILTVLEWPIYDGDLESFQNDWVEIGIENTKPLKPTKQQEQDEQEQRLRKVPEFLQHSLEQFREREQLHHSLSGRFYKFVTFDTDHNSKSERKEWGHLKYQRR